MSRSLHSNSAEMAVLGSALVDEVMLSIVAGATPEEWFYFPQNRALLKCLKRMWDAGRPIDAASVAEHLSDSGLAEEVGGLAHVEKVIAMGTTEESFRAHLASLADKHAAREVSRIGEGMVRATLEGKHRPQAIIERALSRLSTISSSMNARRGMNTRGDFIANERANMHRGPDEGIPMPYEKISQFTGDLVPGDAVGIPGYSNSGKTLFVANLARFWAINDHPSIWFPTESQERFLSRVAAAHARIPQAYPERNSWHQAQPSEREAYEAALTDLSECPWDIVPQRMITPQEIIAQATVRRREYDGRPVIVVIDHMHRLNYGGANPAFAVPQATQDLRNWAGDDRHGGIVLVMLYQPRKPEIDVSVYKPVSGYGISGSGLTMAELDLIISPYRRWVKTSPEWQHNPYHRTPWGTARGLSTNSGHPDFAKPESDGAKVDDEHVYLKIGKRRTGGEGPTLMLNIDAPSGHIYQLEAHGTAFRSTGT
jgi:replicative DNA helicase